jgi:hypothetical protein
MTTDLSEKAAESSSSAQPFRVRLPGFLIHEEVGLGDAVKRITYAAGIKPCEGCQRRAAVLNRWLTFNPR